MPLPKGVRVQLPPGAFPLFFQRLAAAFLAIAFRFAGDSAAARALPPLLPPSFPNATAAGFLVSGGGGGALPVA